MMNRMIANSSDPEGDAVTYRFELDTVPTFDSGNLVQSNVIAEGINETSFPLSALSDDTRYFWRARATDSYVDSEWSGAEFFVNTANNAPTTPTAANPGGAAWVELLSPTLVVNPATDSDED